jgi:hypothetical protein
LEQHVAVIELLLVFLPLLARVLQLLTHTLEVDIGSL